MESKIIILSNRLPVTVTSKGENLELMKSVGGLATGLESMITNDKCLWIGWAGIPIDSLTPEQQKYCTDTLQTQRLIPVWLTKGEVKAYYDDYCNSVIWPLFHSLTGELPLQFSGFDAYREVNEKFANVAIDLYREGDIIWVHDTHLMLVPTMIRAKCPNAKIGFFLHIPFPAPEILSILPEKKEILYGLLGSDVIGFHTINYSNQFTLASSSLLNLVTGNKVIYYQHRQVQIGTYPMGIDAEKFAMEAQKEATIARALKFRGNDGCKIILGIDRLDYTKGIPRRFKAFHTLLKTHPEHIEKIRFIQLAVPSRGAVSAYQEYQKKVEALIAKIQGEFSTPNWTPIHYMYQSLPFQDIVALYLAADVMLVTSVKDGMNLVAKEYVASRAGNGGVLVLSEFAGASDELKEALKVNPYDTLHQAQVIHQALTMKREEQDARMKYLKTSVTVNNIYHWIQQYLGSLNPKSSATFQLRNSSEENSADSVPATSVDFVLQKVLKKIQKPQLAAGQVVLFLDYDGTLIPHQNDLLKCDPTPVVIDTLASLASSDKLGVHIVSGRPTALLLRWFSHIKKIGLHAEHGNYSKLAEQERFIDNWERINGHKDLTWKPTVKEIFQQLCPIHPGSSIEEKELAICWHYRNADRVGKSTVHKIVTMLKTSLATYSVDILSGDKVIEVCPTGLNKGFVIEHVIGQYQSRGIKILPIAIGDDKTDEYMFSSVHSNNGISIHVGSKLSAAKFRFEDCNQTIDFLQQLNKVMNVNQ